MQVAISAALAYPDFLICPSAADLPQPASLLL
jgi:hypothetical protein